MSKKLIILEITLINDIKTIQPSSTSDYSIHIIRFWCRFRETGWNLHNPLAFLRVVP